VVPEVVSLYGDNEEMMWWFWFSFKRFSLSDC